jgi:hypothetical protein
MVVTCDNPLAPSKIRIAREVKLFLKPPSLVSLPRDLFLFIKRVLGHTAKKHLGIMVA